MVLGSVVQISGCCWRSFVELRQGFNFYFPQDLDDEFLVISGTFGAEPWRRRAEFAACRQFESVLEGT